jgi:small-conductance mechanosensitive channel
MVAIDVGLKILFTILTLLSAVGAGLLLRRMLVRRLRKTVLDEWAIQTLGVLIFLPPLAIAAGVIPLIWDPTLIRAYWDNINQQLRLNLVGLSQNLIETLLLIGLGIGLARTIKKVIIQGLGENRIDINIRTFVGRIFYFAILIIVIFWALSIWQIAVIPVTAIGILTVAFTVAIQDVLKDLVAGFYILLERPFHIGDQISSSTTITYTGTVEDIQLRATKLRLVSGEEVTIPNSLVFGSSVVNNTYYGERRATIIATMPEEDFVKSETIVQILKALGDNESVMLKPEPSATLTGYANKRATLTIRFWVATRQYEVVSDVMYALHSTLPSADLSIQESAGNV